MAAAYLLQMVPGKVGNPLHEVLGLVLVALVVAHHVLNRGWVRRLRGRRDLRSRVTMAGDALLTACVVAAAATGVLMSRTLAPWLAVPTLAHVVRPLHGACTYLGLMLAALHAGLHARAVRGHVWRVLAGRGGTHDAGAARVVRVACVLAGGWAFVRLGVPGKLLGQPSFPDAITPAWLQLLGHGALAAPFVALGALLGKARETSTGEGKDS
jgi:hypothetical protein